MIEGKWKIDRSYKNICIEMMTENLASLRAKADITQGEISNLIGISRQTYYAIETGQRTMSWNTYLSLLLQICRLAQRSCLRPSQEPKIFARQFSQRKSRLKTLSGDFKEVATWRFMALVKRAQMLSSN